VISAPFTAPAFALTQVASGKPVWSWKPNPQTPRCRSNALSTEPLETIFTIVYASLKIARKDAPDPFYIHHTYFLKVHNIPSLFLQRSDNDPICVLWYRLRYLTQHSRGSRRDSHLCAATTSSASLWIYALVAKGPFSFDLHKDSRNFHPPRSMTIYHHLGKLWG